MSPWMLVLGAVALRAGSAHAAPQDAATTQLVEAAVLDYGARKWRPAEAKLKKALKQCDRDQCSERVRARVYRALGAVQIAGLKNVQAGSESLALAVQSDPEARFEKDLATRDVLAAYVEMGGPSGTVKSPKPEKARAEAEKPAPSKKKRAKAEKQKVVEIEEEEEEGDSNDEEIVLEEDSETEEEPEKKTKAGGNALAEKKNFVSLALQQDVLLLSGDQHTCGGNTYRCFASGEEYKETPYAMGGNGVSGGFALATTRILAGYDRLLFGQLLAGARLGFAFRGAPEGFLPVHVELRAQYYFADRPFTRTGFRPYAGLGFGLGQVDASVAVEVYANEQAYTAGESQKLDAWRKAGAWFVAPTVGAAYAFGSSSSVFAELRSSILFGNGGFAPALALGYAHGL